jgi:hypothetical protein
MIDLAAQTQLFNLRRTLAVFSDCEEHTECTVDACRGRRYRYQLWWPTGLDNDRMCLGIFANPSTATADKSDPTLTRWRNFCRDWGFGWSVTANVRAWRETDPKLLPPPPARPPTLEEIIADLPRPPRREESLVIWLAWSRWGR